MKKLLTIATISISVIFVSSCGSNTGNSTSDSKNGPAVAESGENIFKRNCVSCHQASGEGIPATYPPLAKSDFLADKEKTITQVLKGYSGELVVNGVKYNGAMPAQTLTDEETSAVLTYIYNSFGNSGGSVTADEVKAVRAKLQ